MNEECRKEIKKLVLDKVTKKLNDPNNDIGENKPFFEAIFGQDTVTLAALVQSAYTSFGMSIYEQISVILAKNAGFHAESQYTLKGNIDENTANYINSHIDSLKSDLKNKIVTTSDKKNETAEIQKRIEETSTPSVHGDSTVDVYIKKTDGTEYYIDITTVKNNLKGFQALKHKMLNWVALRSSTDKTVDVKTIVAIPYNPYYPDNYFDKQWNAQILDQQNDILIQEDYWNFVGNDNNTYNELLTIFNEVGEEVKDKVVDFLK